MEAISQLKLSSQVIQGCIMLNKTFSTYWITRMAQSPFLLRNAYQCPPPKKITPVDSHHHEPKKKKKSQDPDMLFQRDIQGWPTFELQSSERDCALSFE